MPVFRKKKRKEKAPIEIFSTLTANGVNIEAVNFSLHKDKNSVPKLEVRTKDICEALHYEKVDFILKTSIKQVNVKAVFDKAVSEKHFKLYTFDIEAYSQFYI